MIWPSKLGAGSTSRIYTTRDVQTRLGPQNLFYGNDVHFSNVRTPLTQVMLHITHITSDPGNKCQNNFDGS
jgi:hypothetical protein